MVFHVKTTLNIADPVMRRLKEEAARRGTTMSALVEAGLRRVLAAPDGPAERESLPPLPSWDSGGFPVDIADRDALDRVLNEDRDAALYGSDRAPWCWSSTRTFWCTQPTGVRTGGGPAAAFWTGRGAVRHPRFSPGVSVANSFG